MFRKLHGFTIMEVMMVLVIIGVLTTLSVPRYQDFVGRAQVTDAVVLLNSSRPDIEEHILENGYFPENEKFVSIGSIRHGTYTKGIGVALADSCGTAGIIQATMQSNGVSGNVAGKTFNIQRDIVGNWSCT
ncbi:MAG: pilin, partial [Gammaproteobacteria bacterium]|nr:pilin [Gammaproteobacteria bacterium]